ncbi:unnamed protein product [Amoebophrya sp. A25]|nr:unnamed protein product [Amoebophrya sp. A25]|eukprot:GSA25T00006371001.1
MRIMRHQWCPILSAAREAKVTGAEKMLREAIASQSLPEDHPLMKNHAHLCAVRERAEERRVCLATTVEWQSRTLERQRATFSSFFPWQTTKGSAMDEPAPLVPAGATSSSTSGASSPSFGAASPSLGSGASPTIPGSLPSQHPQATRRVNPNEHHEQASMREKLRRNPRYSANLICDKFGIWYLVGSSQIPYPVPAPPMVPGGTDGSFRPVNVYEAPASPQDAQALVRDLQLLRIMHKRKEGHGGRTNKSKSSASEVEDSDQDQKNGGSESNRAEGQGGAATNSCDDNSAAPSPSRASSAASKNGATSKNLSGPELLVEEYGLTLLQAQMFVRELVLHAKEGKRWIALQVAHEVSGSGFFKSSNYQRGRHCRPEHVSAKASRRLNLNKTATERNLSKQGLRSNILNLEKKLASNPRPGDSDSDSSMVVEDQPAPWSKRGKKKKEKRLAKMRKAHDGESSTDDDFETGDLQQHGGTVPWSGSYIGIAFLNLNTWQPGYSDWIWSMFDKDWLSVMALVCLLTLASPAMFL